MKVTYECEVCGLKSTSQHVVEACEARETKRFNPELKPGDVVYDPWSGYGWWRGDRDWFLDKPGDPSHESHHVRGTIGHPLFVVLSVSMNPRIDGTAQCPGEHREIAILFSPSFANIEGRKVLAFCPSVQHKSLLVHRSVTPAELEALAAEAATLKQLPRLL